MAGPVASWTTVAVHGKWLKLDGTPHAGTIRFTVTTRVTNSVDDVIFPPGGVIDAALDSYGAMTVDVPAVDDPDNSPTDWAIKVEEKLTAGGGATYYITPTVAMAGTGLDLRSVVVPVGSITTPSLNVLRGVAGGLAELDGDGDVINADGSKAGSGSTSGGLSIARVNGVLQLDTTSSGSAAVVRTNGYLTLTGA